MKYSFLKNSWFLVLIFAVAATGGISRAADQKMPELKTLSGKTYRDVRIKKVTPSSLSLTPRSGFAQSRFLPSLRSGHRLFQWPSLQNELVASSNTVTLL